MEAVRELLFGKQIEEIRGGMSGLETRLSEAMERSRGMMERKMESIEDFVRSEIGALKGMLSKEESERGRETGEIRTRVESLDQGMQKQLRKIADDLARMDSGVRDRFLDVSKRISNDLDEISSKIQKDIEREVGDLDSNKADRGELGEWLLGMGMRLKGMDPENAPDPETSDGPVRAAQPEFEQPPAPHRNGDSAKADGLLS